MHSYDVLPGGCNRESSHLPKFDKLDTARDVDNGHWSHVNNTISDLQEQTNETALTMSATNLARYPLPSNPF